MQVFARAPLVNDALYVATVVNVNNGRILFDLQLIDLVLGKSLRLNP
jgi:hypothetical protein